MKKDFGKRLLSLMLSVLMVIGIMPMSVFAAQENAFILVAEAGGNLVVAPEYIYYTEEQTVRQALMASHHEFVGIEDDWITAIDGVTGNFKRSDEDGNYELNNPASEVEYYRFSEEENSQPSEGLKQLMTAMADYALKPADVKAAAKEEYDTAYASFVGIDSASAAVLADNINAAVKAYEDSQSGGAFAVTFTDGVNVHAGATITAENAYGKIWSDEDGDGILSLPTGEYYFVLEKNGLRAEGNISVSGAMEIAAVLQEELWLDLDAFRLSGSYEAQNTEDGQFVDDEYALDEWNGRNLTVAVNDIFAGTVYSYVEYNEEILNEIPTLTAIYKSAQNGEEREQELPFESFTSGAVGVLKKGAEGNTVIYRVSRTGDDGFVYSQDYTVTFERVPTLKSISVKDQDGVDQVATEKFDGNINEYTYKVVNDVTAVKINAVPFYDSYSVTVNGAEATGEVTLNISTDEETVFEITVSANGYSNTYKITILPGEGKKFNFITENQAVTLEVVNSNGEVMPYKKFKEGTNGNRYQYVLVPGETYSYVATEDTYYHVADEFRIEDVANSTINVSVPTEDWLTELAFGMKTSSTSKDELPLNGAFSASNHKYEVELVDTEHIPYVWATSIADKNIKIKAIYNQVFSSALYHGVENNVDLISGYTKGEKLNRFLMDENPIENTVTIRLEKEVNGVNQYQDYTVEFKRNLTIKDISAKCDGMTATLVQKDESTGFSSDVKEYSVTVSMAAKILELSFATYKDKKAFGEEEVGYRVKVNGKDVTETGTGEVELNGTIETEIVQILVENEKAPEGTTEYKISVLKSPPVETAFIVAPETAMLAVYETMSGERVWADENGKYRFCEGYSYNYVLTEYGYVGKAGILEVTRDENETLVIKNGEEKYVVTESENGGEVTIEWSLVKAEENNKIDKTIESEWSDFRGNENNNAVVDALIPTSAENGTLYWANQIGEGIDSDAVGSPIIVDGDIVTYAGDEIYRVDTVSGEIKAVGKMDHKSAFSITPPTYAEGMVFVALSDGSVQAFNAETLESLWLFKDPLGGQPNCPINVKNGYLYTGFWNSETGDANFVCLTITDENPNAEKEYKNASWYYTAKGGFYWAGAFVSDEFVIIGTDDGTNKCTSQSSNLLLFDARTGEEFDRWENLNGDIRSTVSYDKQTDAYYFTSKGGSFYSVKVIETENGWKFDNGWSVNLNNGSASTPMSTCSPVVYNGRAYVGVSGAGQFTAYSGHNITVIDLDKKAIAYSVETQGYPQTSGLLTTAYEEESGYVYIYYFDNYTPGKLRVLRDKKGQTEADYLTAEGTRSTAYAIFTPTGNHAQYAICSPIVDEYGTIYFKNDSAHLMAFGSMIEKIEITQNPDKMTYAEGETFDPKGMVVTATYANGKTRDVTDYISFNEDPLSESNKIVTISFKHVLYHNVENGTAMTSGINTSTPVTTIEVEIDGDGEENEVIKGDINSDGTVNVFDLIKLRQYLLESNTEINEANADMNSDGKTNIFDLIALRQKLLEND
ncbi:MAG: cadherin-like beta sandwich domain-containing protein [Oscillospiraceae bacterium]|nr:cadherin-like beta sandwich domain-containing protein [Oscillospiraceae bacterium]